MQPKTSTMKTAKISSLKHSFTSESLKIFRNRMNRNLNLNSILEYEDEPKKDLTPSTQHSNSYTNSSFGCESSKRNRNFSPKKRFIGKIKEDSRALSLSPSKSSTQNSHLKAITGQQALLNYERALSKLEKTEIENYKFVYFLALNVKKPHAYQDLKGNYIGLIGDHISYRYEIIQILGKGTFGQVFKCLDHKFHEFVAVKILKNKRKYAEMGQDETRILQRINENDVEDTKNIVRYKKTIDFRGHLCLVLEILSDNLYQFLVKNELKGLDLILIRRIAQQLLISLRHIHELNIIHCDLKPENILLKHPNKTQIKIIDFGSAFESQGKQFSYIQSRFYRAPEVILGIKYTTAIDIWSLGCILVELYTGKPLFSVQNESDLLSRMTQFLGIPDTQLLQNSKKFSVYFNQNFTLKNAKFRINSKSFSEILDDSDTSFIDFIQRCLV